MSLVKKKVAVVLADGFEEIEAISIIDILKRANIDTSIVGLNRSLVKGAHEIVIRSELYLGDIEDNEYDMLVLPGGFPGVTHLSNSIELRKLLLSFNENSKNIAAICAAPLVLEKAGILKAPYTCYKGFEKNINVSGYVDEKIVHNDNIITSQGPSTAIEFALYLVKIIAGDDVYKKVKEDILF